MKYVMMVTVSLLIAHLGLAKDIKFLTTDIPPYAMGNHSKIGKEGFIIDISRELFKRIGMKLKVVSSYPWARSQQMVIEAKDLLIAPLTRTKKREPNYEWVVPIYKYRVEFLAVDKDVPIKNLALMRKKVICVLRRSPAEGLLEKLKLVHIEKAKKESVCIKKLINKRVDAVFLHGYANGLFHYKQQQKNTAIPLLRGLSYPGGTIYIGGSKGVLSPRVKEELNKKLQEIKADGTYGAILGRYK